MENKFEEINIKNGKVNSLIFECEEEKYRVEIDEDKINVEISEGWRKSYGVLSYDIKEDKFLWYLKHICGAAGYGLGLEDHCTGCDNQFEIEKNHFVSATEDINIVGGSGYFPLRLGIEKFAELISKEIPKYCKSLEERI